MLYRATIAVYFEIHHVKASATIATTGLTIINVFSLSLRDSLFSWHIALLRSSMLKDTDISGHTIEAYEGMEV